VLFPAMAGELLVAVSATPLLEPKGGDYPKPSAQIDPDCVLSDGIETKTDHRAEHDSDRNPASIYLVHRRQPIAGARLRWSFSRSSAIHEPRRGRRSGGRHSKQ
jgi:hypothetical protein